MQAVHVTYTPGCTAEHVPVLPAMSGPMQGRAGCSSSSRAQAEEAAAAPRVSDTLLLVGCAVALRAYCLSPSIRSPGSSCDTYVHACSNHGWRLLTQ
jgi:hypothetical protein